jgi:hypothetical protein
MRTLSETTEKRRFADACELLASKGNNISEVIDNCMAIETSQDQPYTVRQIAELADLLEAVAKGFRLL